MVCSSPPHGLIPLFTLHQVFRIDRDGDGEEETAAKGGHMKLATRLTHLSRPNCKEVGGRTFVNPPIQRGSTVLFPDVADRLGSWGKDRWDQKLVYGICGTQTHHALETVVADIEGGTRCQITSSGLSGMSWGVI